MDERDKAIAEHLAQHGDDYAQLTPEQRGPSPREIMRRSYHDYLDGRIERKECMRQLVRAGVALPVISILLNGKSR